MTTFQQAANEIEMWDDAWLNLMERQRQPLTDTQSLNSLQCSGRSVETGTGAIDDDMVLARGNPEAWGLASRAMAWADLDKGRASYRLLGISYRRSGPPASMHWCFGDFGAILNDGRTTASSHCKTKGPYSGRFEQFPHGTIAQLPYPSSL